jgi:hypothetical protein
VQCQLGHHDLRGAFEWSFLVIVDDKGSAFGDHFAGSGRSIFFFMRFLKMWAKGFTPKLGFNRLLEALPPAFQG